MGEQRQSGLCPECGRWDESMLPDQQELGPHGTCTYRGKPRVRAWFGGARRATTTDLELSSSRRSTPVVPRDVRAGVMALRRLIDSGQRPARYYRRLTLDEMRSDLVVFGHLRASNGGFLTDDEQRWKDALLLVLRDEKKKASQRSIQEESEARRAARQARRDYLRQAYREEHSEYVNPWSARNSAPPPKLTHTVGGGLPTLGKRAR